MEWLIISALAIVVSLPLLKLTWQDVYNKRMVDERQVYFIMGAISLMFLLRTYEVGFFKFAYLLIASLILSQAFHHQLGLGSPDTSLIQLFVLLFSLYEWQLGVLFVAILLITTLAYLGWCKLLCKPLPQPYLPVILITWALTNLLMFNPAWFSVLPFKFL